MTVAFSVVHGDTVNGRFFETVATYAHRQLNVETQRLADALKEAAGHLPEDLAEKYRGIAEQRNFHDSFVNCQSGPLLSMGRGRLCQGFLDQTDADWMFMSDSDMVFSAETPYQMVQFAESQRLERGIKMLGGVAWIVQFDPSGTIAHTIPNVYKWMHVKEGECLVPLTAEELPENSLCKVGAIGGAVMCLHRDLLVKIRDEVCGGNPFWWHHLPALNDDQYGEDVSFSIRVRQAGEDVWVHTLPEFGHAKTVTVYRDTVLYRGRVPENLDDLKRKDG